MRMYGQEPPEPPRSGGAGEGIGRGGTPGWRGQWVWRRRLALLWRRRWLRWRAARLRYGVGYWGPYFWGPPRFPLGPWGGQRGPFAGPWKGAGPRAQQQRSGPGGVWNAGISETGVARSHAAVTPAGGPQRSGPEPPPMGAASQGIPDPIDSEKARA